MIGRQKEIKLLEECYTSKISEFAVILGRRRIGKTFLVNQVFKDRFSFCFVGGHKLSQAEQLSSFAIAIARFSDSATIPSFSNWSEAFLALEKLLEKSKTKKKVIFIDEMPWIDTPKSKFISALENFWNGWANLRDDIYLIATGSATSWIAEKLFSNQGGLYNRITQQIYLSPFTLGEVKQYMASKKCTWDEYQLVQTYMALGGVPYYLSLLDGQKSLAQNIDSLFFEKNARLQNEFEELYTTLFNDAEKYISIVELLAQNKKGVTREFIAEKIHLTGGILTKYLNNLERCDFIQSFTPFGSKKKGSIFKLVDFYTLFHLKFIKGYSKRDHKFWTHSLNTPGINSWQGLAFELVCLQHIDQIKKALGISGMLTEVSAWRDENNQIDLVIDRADRMVNLCEIKFSKDLYSICNDYAEKLRERSTNFKTSTKTRKGILNTFVTTYGVSKGQNGSLIDCEVKMNSLFDEVE